MTYNSFLYLWRNARDVYSEIKVPIIANSGGDASHRFVYYNNNDIVYLYFMHIYSSGPPNNGRELFPSHHPAIFPDRAAHARRKLYYYYIDTRVL